MGTFLSASCSLVALLFIGCVTNMFEGKEGNYLDDRRGEFMWGVATAAYQIEGATTIDNRGPSIWDEFVSQPGTIASADNAEEADLSYFKYKDDAELMKSLGVKYYRFSISWSRIYPKGSGLINDAGVLHYNNVINNLIENELEPVVTLYHWDLPSYLENKYGGWLNESVVEDFAAYAATCFELFGDRVSIWITLNEPWTFVLNGYVSGGDVTTGTMAPGRCSDRSRCRHGDSATEGYIVAHNALLAHAEAVRRFRTKGPKKSVIGISLNIDWSYPLNSSASDDVSAAMRRNEYTFGWFADPIFFGRYPQTMREGAGLRLPYFTKEEEEKVKGSVDFIGLNHYTSWFVRNQDSTNVPSQQGWYADQRTVASKYGLSGNLIGPQGGSVWLNSVPQGIYDTIMWVSTRYGFPPVIITENGCDMLGEDEPTAFDQTVFDAWSSAFNRRKSLESLLDKQSNTTKLFLTDLYRVQYYESYVAEVRRSISDGANIRGYFAWSLLDNFEWSDGYDKRFGLFRVNFTDPQRRRSPKLSAFHYRHIVQTSDMGMQDMPKSKRFRQSSLNHDGRFLSYFEGAVEKMLLNATKLVRILSNVANP